MAWLDKRADMLVNKNNVKITTDCVGGPYYWVTMSDMHTARHCRHCQHNIVGLFSVVIANGAQYWLGKSSIEVIHDMSAARMEFIRSSI